MINTVIERNSEILRSPEFENATLSSTMEPIADGWSAMRFELTITAQGELLAITPQLDGGCRSGREVSFQGSSDLDDDNVISVGGARCIGRITLTDGESPNIEEMYSVSLNAIDGEARKNLHDSFDMAFPDRVKFIE